MRFRTILALTVASMLLPSTSLVAQQPLRKVQPVGQVRQASFAGCTSCGTTVPMDGGCCSGCGTDLWTGYDSCGASACHLIPPCGPICCGSAIVGEMLCGIKNHVDRKLSCLFSCCFAHGQGCGCGACGGYVEAGCGCGDYGCDGGCGEVMSTMTPMEAVPTPSANSINPFQDDPPQPTPRAGSTTRRPVYSIRRTSYQQPVQQRGRKQVNGGGLKRVGTGMLSPFAPKRKNQVRRTATPSRQTYPGSKPLVRFQN